MDFPISLDQVKKRRKYRPDDVCAKRNKHYGQSKLFWGTLAWMVKYIPIDAEVTLLYIGAGPGMTIPVLAKMFPKVRFVLYDSRFDDSVRNYENRIADAPLSSVEFSPGIMVRQRYFYDKDMDEFKTIKPLYLVSDIRNLQIDTAHGKSRDAMIKADVAFQEKVFMELNPVSALLKMRIPYYQKTSKQLNGIVYFQPFAKADSTETRLVPHRRYKNWDTKAYEEKLSYFNNVIRIKGWDLRYRFETLKAYLSLGGTNATTKMVDDYYKKNLADNFYLSKPKWDISPFKKTLL